MITRLTSHIEEYIARYTVILLAVLVPLAGLLGEVASNLGGADTPAGKYALGAASAVGAAAGGLTFLHNLGKYQIARDFGPIPGDIDQLIAAAKQTITQEATTTPDDPSSASLGLAVSGTTPPDAA